MWATLRAQLDPRSVSLLSGQDNYAASSGSCGTEGRPMLRFQREKESYTEYLHV